MSVKQISGRLFSAVFLIGIIAVMGFGVVNLVQAAADIATGTATKTVVAAGVTVKPNDVPVAVNCGSDSGSVVGNVKVEIITASLPVGAGSTVYNQKVQATGGVAPYAWSISIGSLPAGLSLNASTGEITGTPATCGNSKFTIRVTDSQNPAVTVTKTFSITINPSALIIITSSFPDGAVRTAYSQKVKATGGFFPYVWSISAGSLPAGLSFNASTGEIIGRPTTVGTSKFTVQVTDSQKPATVVTKALSIKIAPTTSPSMWFSPI